MAVRTKTKPSRNAPCPCGSGLKFKRCCLQNTNHVGLASKDTSEPPGSQTSASTNHTSAGERSTGKNRVASWKHVCCQVLLSEDHFLVLTLAYSADFLQRVGLQSGKFLALELPEINFHGHGFVMAVQEASTPASREGELLVVLERQPESEFGILTFGEGVLAQEIMAHRRKLSREIVLVMEKPDGTWVDITLLRSAKWLESQKAQVGRELFLDLPHLGVRGFAKVTAINPCPLLPTPGTSPQRSQFVTGTFCHSSGDVFDLKLKKERQPLGVTATHPFWSVDRKDWVCAIDLRLGERLETIKGTTQVESLKKRPNPETVYNIEVEGDHVYRVGESGILVHNASVKDCQFFPLTFNTSAGVVDGIKYFSSEAIPGDTKQRATKVQARINKGNIGKGTDASFTPPGWITGLNVVGQATKIARGHLLANILGGSGSDPRNIVPICHQSTNTDMKNDIEIRVRDLVNNGTCPTVDYEVTVTYNDPQNPAVPSSIHVKAHVFDINQCTKYEQTFPNESDLNNCS